MSADDLPLLTPSTSTETEVQKRQRRTKQQMAADARAEQDKTRPRNKGKDYSQKSRFDASRRAVDLDAITAITQGKTPSAQHSRADTSGKSQARANGRADETPPTIAHPSQKDEVGGAEPDTGLRTLFGEADDEPQIAKRGQARSLADFASEHDLDVKELYNLVVPGDEGEEPMTVGKLKDMRQEFRQLDSQKVEFEEAQETAWSEVYQARTDVDGVLEELARYANPQQLNSAFEEARARHQVRLEIGHKTLMERFPQWRDASVMRADRERISTFAHKELGISPREFGQIFDPRVIIGLNRLERLTSWFRKGMEGGRPEAKPNTTAPSGRKSSPPNRQQEAKVLAKQGDKVGAIARLIG